ncbi:MAG: HvfC/BufC N-terminal domain-containing protein [Geminicoccaceae bacterium]
MPSLIDVQSAFIDALKRPEAPVPDVIRKENGQPVKRRFDVYRNNVAAGMIEALRATFPAVEKLVGDAFFAAAARVYLDRHPPRSPLLFRYGEHFGDFLDGFSPAASTPYLSDVANLEWAWLKAYHAPDREPLSIDVLSKFLQAGTDVGKLGITLHPSLMLIKSRWPIVSLWAASTGQGKPSDVDMKQPERALVIRPKLIVETSVLPAGGFAFMSALSDGGTLEDATILANDAAGDFDLTEHLQGLFAIGAVAAITNHQS